MTGVAVGNERGQRRPVGGGAEAAHVASLTHTARSR
jgi:hypothetical protein